MTLRSVKIATLIGSVGVAYLSFLLDARAQQAGNADEEFKLVFVYATVENAAQIEEGNVQRT